MNGETMFKIFYSVLAAILILLAVCCVFFSAPRGYYLETFSRYGITSYSVRQDVRFREDRRIFTHHDYNETVHIYNILKED